MLKKVYGTLLPQNIFVCEYFTKIEVAKLPQKYLKKEVNGTVFVSFNNIGGIVEGDHVVLCLNNIPATEERY